VSGRDRVSGRVGHSVQSRHPRLQPQSFLHGKQQKACPFCAVLLRQFTANAIIAEELIGGRSAFRLRRARGHQRSAKLPARRELWERDQAMTMLVA